MLRFISPASAGLINEYLAEAKLRMQFCRMRQPVRQQSGRTDAAVIMAFSAFPAGRAAADMLSLLFFIQ